MEINKQTPTSMMRKAFRQASLKYHPDKNKSPEALDIYLSLNDIQEVLKDSEKKEYYDYYGVKDYDKIPKPTAMGDSEEEYKFNLFFQRLLFALSHIPVYLAWLFIPIAYLDQKKRKTKLVIVILVFALAALDLGFMTKVLPDSLKIIVSTLTPATWTYKEFFKVVHIAVPYLIVLVIAYFDIFILRVHEENDTDEERFKKNITGQNKVCRRMIKNQTELINYLDKISSMNEDIKKNIVDLNKKIYQQMKKILNVEQDNEKIEGKWTWGKILSAGMFILFIINSVKS
mmetsp:Transcript_2079/g.2350  ORF Transcript_2079/g.2350 Transcript_2079/m.2350 type:complete len:287 (+) Transcript_2079:176-1036(+)